MFEHEHNSIVLCAVIEKLEMSSWLLSWDILLDKIKNNLIKLYKLDLQIICYCTTLMRMSINDFFHEM